MVLDSENPQDSSYDSQIESELSGTSDGPIFMLNDIRQELEEAAKHMSSSSKINMMLVDFSTPMFTAYITKGSESDTLPQSAARDFFLHSLSPDKFTDNIDIDYKALINRELNGLAHKLRIVKIEFALEPNDWLSVTKLMLTFVAMSLEAKLSKQSEIPKFIS